MAYTEVTTTSYLRNQRHTGFNSILKSKAQQSR